MHINWQAGNLIRGDHLDDIDTDGMIIIKGCGWDSRAQKWVQL
jgi:hypothetical protein